jgi:hypothetical protein
MLNKYLHGVKLFISISFAVALYVFNTTSSIAAAQKSIEFGSLIKPIMLKSGNEKYDPSISYKADWNQIDNPVYYSLTKKEFAEVYQGTVRQLLIFNGKPAMEAYKKNKNASWGISAVGSRAGVDKVTFSSSINDGADENEIISSLNKVGISATVLRCDENNKEIDEYKTGIMFKVYKLTSKGYLPSTLVIAGDVAAQHISLDITLIPNVKELYPACK